MVLCISLSTSFANIQFHFRHSIFLLQIEDEDLHGARKSILTNYDSNELRQYHADVFDITCSMEQQDKNWRGRNIS
jgi:hypothetical protein